MNYQWHYDQLMITRSLREKLSGIYYEKHHKIPRSMGGDNSSENIVSLTPREHFLAHWLLWRIYKNRSMAFAFHAMEKFTRTKTEFTCSSRAYEEARIAKSLMGHSELTKSKMSSSKKGKSSSFKGKFHKEDSKEKMRNVHLGKSLNDDHKQKIRESNIGKHDHLFGNTNHSGHFHTDESKQKIKDSKLGVKTGPRSKETKLRMSEARKLFWINKKNLDT